MTIKELIKILESYPDDTEIWVTSVIKSEPGINNLLDINITEVSTYFEEEKVLFFI